MTTAARRAGVALASLLAIAACTGEISERSAREADRPTDAALADGGDLRRVDGGALVMPDAGDDASTASDAGTAGGFVDFGVGIGVSAYHACIVAADGEVVCWGNPQPRSTPPKGLHAVALASGHLHNCVLTTADADERVLCFGFGGDSIVPPTGLDPVQVSVGQSISCALERDGRVVCWGDDDTMPVPPEDLRAKFISTAGAFSCAIAIDDRVRCWGVHPPELPEPELRALHVSVAQNEGTAGTVATYPRHACAVKLDHSVVCWGDDQGGEVGEVPADLRAREVAIGNTHACAIDLEGAVVCWGRAEGEVPLPDLGGVRARALRLVHHNGCLLPEDSDQLVCWGRNDRMQASGPDDETVFVPNL
jgi:hypothetical protein